MANKKNGKLNYNGKEISFDMAAQLEETNKKLKETLKLQKEHTKELKEQGKISDELYRKRQEQYKLDNKVQKVMHNGLKLTRQQQKELITDVDENNNIISRSISKAKSNQKKRFTGLNDWYADYTQQKYNRAYQEIAERQYNDYSKNGKKSLSQDEYNRMQNEIEKEFTETLKVSGKNFGKYTEVFKAATDTFNKAVSVWVGVAKAGLNNQSTAFENSFENISVRNGVTRQNYYDTQWRVNNRLLDLGLRNNIATSDIQNMWNTMASNGVVIDMSTEKARANITANAIDLVLTNKIVPYLNTSSQEFQILNSRIDNKFIKDIRGINLANNEIAGNNYATQELLQTIIDQVQPMSDEALENLAQGSTEVTAMINSLIEAGYSPDAAKSYAVQLFKTQRYSDQVMRSGTLSERMALLDSINSGINIYNPEDWNDYIGTAVNTDQMIASWTPGYTSTMGGVISNVVGSATIGGDYYSRIWGAKNAQEKGITGTDLINSTDLTPEQIAQFSNRASNSYANDINQTQTQLQNITLENFMNELAVGKQGLGHWTDVIVTAIKGIGTIIMTKIVGGAIGKGIGALAGIGGSTLGTSAGLGALLGAAGPIALGVAGVAAVAYGINAIIKNKSQKAANDTETTVNNRVQAMIEEGKIDEALGGVESSNQKVVEEYKYHKDNIFSTNGIKDSSLILPSGEYTGISLNYQSSPIQIGRSPIADIVANSYGVRGAYLKYGQYTGIKDLDDETKSKYGINTDGWANYWLNDAEILNLSLNELSKKGEWEKYNRLKLALFASSVNGDINKLNNARVALMVEWLFGNHDKSHSVYTNALSSEFGITDMSTDFLTAMIEHYGLTSASDVMAAVDLLKQTDTFLNDGNSSGNGWVGYDSVTKENLAKFNLHRYGLDTVPYDNYPALLHEGEAVLTASTANTLRSLLDEYQQTSTQAVNFDTIIQTQTSALIAKMEEIIVVLTNNRGSNFTSTPEQTNARNILMNSMLHITSTKSF